MPPILSDLATEILEIVSLSLDPNDLRSLRAVCQNLSRKTFESYGRANFATLETDLSQKSLRRVSLASAFTYFLVPKPFFITQGTRITALLPRLDAHPRSGRC